MRSRVILFFLTILVSLPTLLTAQKKDDFKQPRVLVLLDGSSSMVNDWHSGKNRFKAASEIVLKLMDSIYLANPNVEFALRVYGHEHHVPENNCFDTRREVMFSKNNIVQMDLRLESLRPKGVSPIAYSLQQAAEFDFVNERDYAYSLVLITDGGESCGGNICAVVESLLQRKIQFRPYIISLVDYAPLREQYACLGTYLQVTRPGEMGPAINTIAEAYKKFLAVPIAKPKEEKQKPVVAAVPKAVAAPVVIPPKEKEVEKVVMQPVQPKQTPVIERSVPAPVVERPVEKPRVNSRIQVDTEPVTKEQIASMQPRVSRKALPTYWAIETSRPRRNLPGLRIPGRDADTVRAVITSAPKPAAPKPTPAKPSVTKPAAPVKKPAVNPNEKIAEYNLTKEPSGETTLQVYFTNGKGKFYTTTPRLLLVDPKTGVVVHRFFRTIDAQGNPDPVKIPEGTFDVRFEKNPDLVSKNVTITKDNHQKLVILVRNSGLQFRYADNSKRPVKEYTATVKRLFDNSPLQQQPCDKIVEYEPGSYHIEIPGILPLKRWYLDLDFDHIYTIDMQEDGFLQFVNTSPMGRVRLFYQDGDRMEYFYTMEVNGQQEAQKLRLQPGPYEARYRGIVQPFVVKSNDTTQLELK